MQDFRTYNYTLDFNEILTQIAEAHAGGYSTLIVINGEYYDIDPATIPEAKTRDFIDELNI